MASLSPTLRLISVSTSSANLALFSWLPPYASVLRLCSGEVHWLRHQSCPPWRSTISKPARRGRSAAAAYWSISLSMSSCVHALTWIVRPRRTMVTSEDYLLSILRNEHLSIRKALHMVFYIRSFALDRIAFSEGSLGSQPSFSSASIAARRTSSMSSFSSDTSDCTAC
jgi:hypothetical protein